MLEELVNPLDTFEHLGREGLHELQLRGLDAEKDDLLATLLEVFQQEGDGQGVRRDKQVATPRRARRQRRWCQARAPSAPRPRAAARQAACAG